ncbi:uncharacterized protein [Venturia canescens]|uniref:uncharacterized protein n=1 Tax=Venturia canescens TaxID=32260 RepID=UPI001C9C8299|nr:uncharacterized protein LOC122414664 [Venturia canescens]
MGPINVPRFIILDTLSKRNPLDWWMQVTLVSLTTLFVSVKLDGITATGYDSFGTSNKPDAVLINFSPRVNSSKTPRHLYLPNGDDQHPFVPEVIDNRVRLTNSGFRPFVPSTSSFAVNASPDAPLRTHPSAPTESPFRNNFFRPNTSPRSSTSSFAGFTGISGVSQIDPVPKEFSDFYVQVNSMSCLNSGDDLFFRVSMRPPRVTERPIIDGVVADACRIERINDEYRINFGHELFWACGVHECSNDRERYYCLNVRFPAISGLRLKEDHKVTLRCKTQDKTASHMKQVNVKTLDTSGRNTPKVETGGYKNVFETEVGLYRKTFGSGHLFDAKIQPGGTVILGEEVLLRALVREGDGWRYSRISDVTVHYVEKASRTKIMNSLWILDANGCLNPQVKEICSREQYRVSPLETYLMFEAFMFDNMKATDEMVMNVRITGCLDGADCALHCPAGHSRRVRSLENKGTQNETIDWSNDITFRVVLPEDPVVKSSPKSIDTHLVLPYILSAIVLITIIALLATIKIFKRQRVNKI